ncbi:MAG: V-type ATP synthase subunit F [Gammaproteobacteria bacterium]
MATLRAIYIGEAVTASGFALVGVQPRATPIEADAVWQAVRAARRNSDVIILNQAHANVIQERLQELISAEPIPPVIVVPTMDNKEPALDRVVGPARRVLGLS